MSSSKSNVSNQSSRSNLLTLSQDSQSSQLKSHRANLYYKKFISKLGFLFRVDTQDLDALYNKIAQCLQEGQGLSQSDDADINELIEMAKQLQYNHSLLKNMVEILDRRFLQKSNTSQKDLSLKQDYGQFVQTTPKQKKTQKQSVHVATPMSINKYQSNRFELNNNQQTADQISGLFNNTLEQARNSMRRKKDQQLSKKKQTNNQNAKIELRNSRLTDQSNKSGQFFSHLSGSKYEGRVQKIFEQMNKIKMQLSKIQQTSHQEQKYSYPSIALPDKSITTQSLPAVVENKFPQDQHQQFKQVQQDTYFLVDDRYISSEQPSSPSHVPKLSLKQLYARMKMKDDNANVGEDRQDMGVIRQTSRQSDNQYQNGKDFVENLDTQKYKSEGKNHENTIAQSKDDELLGKTKSVNNSTSADNATLQNSQHQFDREYQEKKVIFQQRKNQYFEHVNEDQSEKSYEGSNVTLIQRLNFNQSIKPSRKNTNTSIIDTIYFNQNEDDASKKAQVFGSIQTTTMGHSASQPQFETISKDGRFNNIFESPKNNKNYYETSQGLPGQSESSRQKINHYLMRLDERNKILKKYVTEIEFNVNKQKQLRQQIGLKSLQGKSQVSNAKTLTNLVYTDNEAITPKYIPNVIKHDKPYSQPHHKDHRQLKTQQTYLGESEVQPGQNRRSKFYPNDNNTFLNSEINSSYSQDKQKPVIPHLKTLKQNGLNERHVFAEMNKEQQQLQMKPMKNNLYTNNNKQAGQHSHQEICHYNKLSKVSWEQGGHESNQQGSFKNIEIQSKNSANSIEDRMQHKQLNIGHDDVSKKFIIPRNSNKSLFDQTRNVESKIELSEDRIFKIRVPGQEIQKIKLRVTEMFKKIKSISDDTMNNQQIPRPVQQSQGNDISKNAIIAPVKNEEIKRFEFKTPENFIQKQLNSKATAKKSSFIDRIDSENRFTAENANANMQGCLKSSFVIEKTNGGQGVRMSFMSGQLQRSNGSREKNVPSSSNNRAIHLINSRESNFSFKNPNIKFGQDSIRSSVTGFNQFGFVLNESYSRPQSVSSSQEKKVIRPVITINSMVVNRPPSTRSSSNQSRKYVTKATLIPTSPTHIPIRNAPPLPLPPRSHKNLAINAVPNQKFHPNNIKSGSIDRRNSSYSLSNEKRPMAAKAVYRTILPQENKNARTPHGYQSPVSPLRLEQMNYSTVMQYKNPGLNSFVKQRNFAPPQVVSVPISLTQKLTSNKQHQISQPPKQTQNMRLAYQNESSIVTRSESYLRDSRNSDSRSKSGSKSRSKKGIKVVSERPKHVERQTSYSYL